MGIIYAVLIVVGVVGGTAGVSWLRRKGHVKTEDLQMAAQLLGLSIAVFDEMNIKQEREIMNIAKLVADAVDYATSVTHNGPTYDSAYAYAAELCAKTGIELNDNRKLIISSLLKMTIQEVKMVEMNIGKALG